MHAMKRLRIAASGDSLITQRLAEISDPDFLDVLQLIQGADTAFTNLETTIHDGCGYPAAQSGGAWMISPPYVADELKWAGFDLMSRANNHCMDWAAEGMIETSAILDRLEITHAGVGMDLAEARRPAYRDTQAGRVALIAASMTFPDEGRAGNARQGVKGRPGLNPLRWREIKLLSPSAFEAMQGIARDAGLGHQVTDESVELFGMRYFPWKMTSVAVEAHPGDMEGILSSVKEAHGQADWVVASLHTHEFSRNVYNPSPVAMELGKKAIENGADMVFMHGAHVLRGIEIYHGKPIFYGLGNFIYQALQLETFPADSFEEANLPLDADSESLFEHQEKHALGWAEKLGILGASKHMYGSAYSVLAVLAFENRSLVDIRLYPVTLGSEHNRSKAGIPRLARGELAARIIRHLQRLSQPMGTQISLASGYGYITMGKGLQAPSISPSWGWA